METVFRSANILLPDESVDMNVWATLACDQFTSQPLYWQKAQNIAKGKPSTLHITLPEVYLEQDDTKQRIEAIHTNMSLYAGELLTKELHGFVYVERTTQSGVRPGLVGRVDLEAYSFLPETKPLIRPSENTVVERIPPRLAVRRDATLETPHIMMLIDDDKCNIIEGFAAKKDRLEKLYDTQLMLDGGRIEGWAVTDAQDIVVIEKGVAFLGAQDIFNAKYPNAANTPPIALAVGDGNHSLATAKAYWDELKENLDNVEKENHPARWALVELVNVHCPAILIEPIHRAVFGTDNETFTTALQSWLLKNTSPCSKEQATQSFEVITEVGESAADLSVNFNNAPHPLAVGTLEMFLTEFCTQNPQVKIDYIHGEDSVRELVATGAVGVLLPEFKKSDLFKGVVLGGVLPKKTFSMGEAVEKRYYMECRKIKL